ncbi:hypothetical protein ALC60_12575 [Trachymyrmex zeteki]|uniref:Uncharacterized protein n=1 Tax=Mycetomoellerius zeteki TaxID=64791 RepID=A0A151WKB5_9HYME|nr:hypothetical protein ALC60_12575 [Trachymyrmex zeteki]
MPEIPNSIPVGTKIFTLVSPKDIENGLRDPYLKHLSKNPPFGTGIKIVGPICSWQMNNQSAHHKHMREV